jgi:hypothetical protein
MMIDVNEVEGASFHEMFSFFVKGDELIVH